jgi:hypothetical protein
LKLLFFCCLFTTIVSANEFFIFEGKFLSGGSITTKTPVMRYLVEFKREAFKCRAWIDMTSADSPSMVQAKFPVILNHSSCIDRGAKLGYTFENIIMLQSSGKLNELNASIQKGVRYIKPKTTFEMILYK